MMASAQQFILSPTFWVGIIVAIAASLISVFIISRKMALTADALSHVALPGMAIALISKLDPFLGAAAFLLFALIFIHFANRLRNIAIDTLIGVSFTFALALGVLLIPEHELIESLFGDITQLSSVDLWLTVVLGVFVITIFFLAFKPITKITFSADLAQSEFISLSKFNALFLLLLMLVVVIGIKMIGALLMGALVVFPAATAQHMTKSLRSMIIASIIFGLIDFVLGLFFASVLHLAVGPTVVIVSTMIFMLSFLIRRTRLV